MYIYFKLKKYIIAKKLDSKNNVIARQSLYNLVIYYNKKIGNNYSNKSYKH